MNELVKVVGNDVFTDSMVIAQGTGNKHISVKEIIGDYTKEFRTLGTLSVLNRESTGGRPEQYYLLNEPQATFLMTLLRNSKKVVAFKLELVKQFYIMKNILQEHNSQHWLQTRVESKSNRKKESDEIKQFVEYATTQGSKTPNRYYTNFSLLADKAAGIEPKKRNNATVNQINNLILAENIIHQVIKTGMKQEMYYKDIYKACKERIEQFREITYLDVQMKEKALT